MNPTPRHRAAGERRRPWRGARNGFLWFAGLWLFLRPLYHRGRDWTVKQLKRLADTRPVALGAAAGLGAMTAGLLAYAMLSHDGYQPQRLLPDLRPTASATHSPPAPAPTPAPSPTPPPVLPPEPPTPTLPPIPEPPPEPTPPPPVEVALPAPTPSPTPSPTPAPTPAPSPTPSPSSAPAPPPTQTCILTPDGGRCLNPNGLVKNSKTPPGPSRR